MQELSLVTATTPTILKSEPVQSSEAREVLNWPRGEQVQCLVQRAAGNHVMLTMPNNEPIAGRFHWYAFRPHVNIHVPGGVRNLPGNTLTENDIAKAAASLEVDVAAFKAVIAVECEGAGFLPSGRPVILFEAHWFSDITGHRYDHSHPEISSRRWDRSLYRGGEQEWDRLELAMRLDYDAAVSSASWGLGQLMGEHRTSLGYSSAQEWVDLMSRSEADQLEAMRRWIKNHPRMHQALQAHQWGKFAYWYNGEGYAENKYDTRLAQEFAKALQQAEY